MFVDSVGGRAGLAPLCARIYHMVDQRYSAEHAHELEIVESAQKISFAEEALLAFGAHGVVGIHFGHFLQREVTALYALILGAVIVEQDGIVGVDLEIVDVVEVAAVGQILAALDGVVGSHVAYVPFWEIGLVVLPCQRGIAGVDVLDAHCAFGVEVIETYVAGTFFLEPVVARCQSGS